MRPADYRNATWREVLTHLTEDLVRVHLAWQAHGPGTTRQVANRSGISILTLRPRTTDLCKLGLVELIEKDTHSLRDQWLDSAGGIYAARTREEAELSCAWQKRADFRKKAGDDPVEAQRVGFITVEQAIASLSPAERRALGARLMGESAHGQHRPEPADSSQLTLLPA